MGDSVVYWSGKGTSGGNRVVIQVVMVVVAVVMVAVEVMGVIMVAVLP